MSEIYEHIANKIEYHEKLLIKYEIEENYEQCIIEKKEIDRLIKLLEVPKKDTKTN